MKRITDIDKNILHPDPDASEEQKKGMPTPRAMLRAMCSNVKPHNVEEGGHLYQCLLKLRDVSASIDFENAEFSAMKKRAVSNEMGWSNSVFTPLMNVLDEAEKTKLPDASKAPELAPA